MVERVRCAGDAAKVRAVQTSVQTSALAWVVPMARYAPELRRNAKLVRLVLARGDMQDAAAAADYLRDTYDRTDGDPFHWHARRALEAGMFAAYARAFNSSRGDEAAGRPPLPPAPTSGLTADERRAHKWAIAERKSVWAHVDRTGHREMVEFTDGDPDVVVALGERWKPATREELSRLGDLAWKLAVRYDAEANALAAELDIPLRPQQ